MAYNHTTARKHVKVQDVGNRVLRRDAKDHGLPNHQARDLPVSTSDGEHTGQTIERRTTHAEPSEEKISTHMDVQGKYIENPHRTHQTLPNFKKKH